MFEFFANGAIKICGNHTEHQGGCVLCSATEQGIRAFAKPNGTDTVHIESEDFGCFDIEIGDTEPKAEEAETPAALVRGIMNCFIESGNIFGGFDAKISSEIPSESVLSSFPAFEILIGKIISGLFFENSVPPLRLAQFGQTAENDYYGNPCGITEQLASAAGGTVFADFSDPEMPQYRKLDFDFHPRYKSQGIPLSLRFQGRSLPPEIFCFLHKNAKHFAPLFRRIFAAKSDIER